MLGSVPAIFNPQPALNRTSAWPKMAVWRKFLANGIAGSQWLWKIAGNVKGILYAPF